MTAITSTPATDTPAAAPEEAALAEVIARLRRAMRRAARAADPDNAFSVAQLELLACVAEHPGIRPSQLARLLRLAPNSVTTLVNGLHTQQMLTRAGNHDRRAVTLTLTTTGHHAVRNWQATNTAILGAALTDIHPGWRHLLGAAVPALRELTRAVDSLADPPVPPARVESTPS